MILKKQFYFNFLLILSTFFFVSCGGDDDGGVQNPTVELNNEATAFVWNALNEWYLFQEDVPILDDSMDDDIDEFNTFLNSYSGPNELFNDIIIDDFSYITDDLTELGSSGFSAVVNTFGYDFILFRTSDTEFVGQIRYVFPGSQAEAAGLERGDFFVEVDGQTLNDNNVDELLFEDDNYTLALATISRDSDGNYVITPDNNEVTINETTLPFTAIWSQEVIDMGSDRVGYLSFSRFEASLHDELVDAFDSFRAAGVNELVLDLRYNPGGTVVTAQILTSLIFSDDPNEFMASLDFNAKREAEAEDLFFLNEAPIFNENFEVQNTRPLISLGLDRIFILTSSSTASSSEFVINSLNPFIDVIMIGDTTVGKNLGSISIYDSPPNFTNEAAANPNHTYGMQPIVTTVSNSIGFNDYSDGFNPNITIREIDFLDDIRPLGDPSEQLLSAALFIICPVCSSAPPTYQPNQNFEKSFESLELNPNYQQIDITGVSLR